MYIYIFTGLTPGEIAAIILLGMFSSLLNGILYEFISISEYSIMHVFGAGARNGWIDLEEICQKV
jgi:hypothetical protein